MCVLVVCRKTMSKVAESLRYLHVKHALSDARYFIHFFCVSILDNAGYHVLHFVSSETQSGAVSKSNYQSRSKLHISACMPCCIGCALFSSNRLCVIMQTMKFIMSSFEASAVVSTARLLAVDTTRYPGTKLAQTHNLL